MTRHWWIGQRYWDAGVHVSGVSGRVDVMGTAVVASHRHRRLHGDDDRAAVQAALLVSGQVARWATAAARARFPGVTALSVGYIRRGGEKNEKKRN